MFANRISQFFSDTESTPGPSEPPPAFVPFPVPLFAIYTAAQQAFVAEVYRRARELTEAQLRKPAHRPRREFSLN
jgi:hypothetical protein